MAVTEIIRTLEAEETITMPLIIHTPDTINKQEEEGMINLPPVQPVTAVEAETPTKCKTTAPNHPNEPTMTSTTISSLKFPPLAFFHANRSVKKSPMQLIN